MMVPGEDTPESYLKDGVDWIFKKNAFNNRIVDNWNSLSENCVAEIASGSWRLLSRSRVSCTHCTTLNNFKSHIRLHWDWKPDSSV